MDTSSIIYGFENRKNVFEVAFGAFPRCQFYISKGIIKELNKLSKNKGRKGAAARLSLRAAEKSKVKIEDDARSGDNWIMRKARTGEYVKVITNDTALAKRLKPLNIKVFKLTEDGRLR